MTKELAFFITGEPKSQARPRFGRNGGVYSPKSSFFHLVYSEALRMGPRTPFSGPLDLTLSFIMPRPKYAMAGRRKALRWHVAKPDLDNLEKAVMDAMTQARVWEDDSLVCRKRSEKILASVDKGVPGVFVRVKPVEDCYFPGLKNDGSALAALNE